MLNLDFWFLFLGFIMCVAGVSTLISPANFKKTFKPLFKDEKHLKMVAVWYLSFGSLAFYSGWSAGAFWQANLVLLFGLLFLANGLGLFFATEWYQDTILHKVLKTDDLKLQIGAGFKFLLGLISLYYGFFFL